eukprot:TRINITY_DN18138_c0_g1_i1.p1 TRINITY_DN18138_c0_g1~~TRINITY_DN18138_c0_g1_i1.p1  ORF type:complete len:480 (-),score=41.26 TRINITY_DN18138_c0_g1_i1:26-1345(-)
MAIDSWLGLLPVLSLLLSFIASGRLLVYLQQLNGRDKKKMFCRQMWHLCVVDLMFCVSLGMYILVDVLSEKGYIVSNSFWCIWWQVCSLGYSFGLDTAILLESHIAMSCLAAMLRSSRVLKSLNAVLGKLWVVGLCLGVGDVWQSTAGGLDTCVFKRDIVAVLLITVCFTICTLSYVLSAVAACVQAGQAVRWRVWSRGQWYVVVALFCFGPLMYRQFVGSAHSHFSANAWTIVARVAASLNGLLNVLVYACQSGQLKKLANRRFRRRQSRIIARWSQQGQVTRAAGESRSTHTTEDLDSDLSFHVAFQGASVHEVDMNCAEAMARAEAEVERHEQNKMQEALQRFLRVLQPGGENPSSQSDDSARTVQGSGGGVRIETADNGADSDTESLLDVFEVPIPPTTGDTQPVRQAEIFEVGSPPQQSPGLLALVGNVENVSS